MTDRTILVAAGPDEIDSIALPDSSRSGSLRSKWTGGDLRASSNSTSCAQMGRRLAVSRATPAPPLARRCRLTHPTRRLPPRRRSLVACHPALPAPAVSMAPLRVRAPPCPVYACQRSAHTGYGGYVGLTCAQSWVPRRLSGFAASPWNTGNSYSSNCMFVVL